jgi:uncharacterized protein
MDRPRIRDLTPVEERVEILDVLRGFAILGIVVVNAEMFFSPITLYITGERWWNGSLDRVVEALVVFLAQAKFYALFAGLFGLGFAKQSERAEARGLRVGPFYAVRLGWLAAIGLVHALLIWYGDILFLYAVLGLFLIPFRERAQSTLLVWAAVLVALPVALQLPVLTGQDAEALAATRASMVEMTETARWAYAQGTWAEIMAIRAREWGLVAGFGILSFGPQILGLFVVGLVLGRRRFFDDLEASRRTMRRALPYLALGGTIGCALQVAGSQQADPLASSVFRVVATAAQMLLAPLMTATYVCTICLAWHRPRVRAWLARLAPVGRMALSNYLSHSIVFTLLAYSYGLGLYGRVPPTLAVLLACAVFLVQVPLSRVWLVRHRFGPVEWLWRSLTYGKLWL